MQIEVVTEKGIPLLFVAVPDKSSHFMISYTKKDYEPFISYDPNTNPYIGEWASIPLTKGKKYEILCLDSQITEEMAKTLVDDCPYFAKCWKHYCPTGRVGEKPIIYDSTVTCWTALESYQSLKRANNIDPSKNWIVLKIEKR